MSSKQGRGDSSQNRGRGSGRGGDRGRGDRGRGGGRGGGPSEAPATMEIPIRSGPPRGRGDRGGRGEFRGRGGDSRGRGGRGDFRGRGSGRGRGQARIYTAPGGVPEPDLEVEKIENRIENEVLKTKPAGSDRGSLFPLRPGFGTQGQKVLLYANYFELSTDSKQVLFRYNTEILPDQAGRRPSQRKAKQIIQLFLDQHLLQYQNSIASDYRSTVISQIELPLQPGSYDVQCRAPDEDEPPANPQIYHVRLQFTGKLMVSELLDYLTSSNASAVFQSKEELLQALNIVMGQYPKKEPLIASVGANKHFSLQPDEQDRLSLGGGLEVLRGFFVSVRAATARLLVNVQVKNIACYEAGELKALIGAVNLSNTYKLEGFLKTLRTDEIYLTPPRVRQHGAGPRHVEFWLESQGPGQGSGEQSSSKAKGKGKKGKKPAKAGPEQAGRYISVADYFLQKHNIALDPNVPVINVGTRQNPSYLPAEVCIVEPGQPANTKLSPQQTQKMIQFAVRSPGENADSIVNNGTQVLGIQPRLNDILSTFRLTPKAGLITVPGRILDAPRVSYRGQKEITPSDGNWNMRSIKFARAAQLPSWTYLILDSARTTKFWPSKEAFTGTLGEFRSKLVELGIEASQPVDGAQVPFAPNDSETVVKEKIEKAVNDLVERVNPRFILVVLPARDTVLYNHIKLVCDVKKGVRHACVLAEKFSKPRNDQYFANEGLKVNLKLGGVNQLLSDSQLGIIAQGRTMLVGIDVTHPSPGSASFAPSIAGIVASVDRQLGQWPADIKIQAARREMVADLDALLKSRLQLWAQHNKGAYPENIIVYRDGVSEGQYEIVLEKELPLLKEACREVYPASDTAKGLPRMSIVVVGKRHHTRFYATTEEMADERSKNPPNGTVVDRGVTEARNWDFYLQAHKALQGTARPAHYFAVWDEIFHKQTPRQPFLNAADILEDLTHRLCYLFGRATKAVSICPPAYYADLVCERARCYLSHVFDATPEQTPASSVIEGEGREQTPDFKDVRIHQNVRNAMFYI
ncbi:Qde2-like protein [Rasamsonia emersonii CBS 393.64]|uniref:Qde2-like protein n=1 Tax=Rasamsonia emersonii (strain ATCC 16479 / CBS 393.64 / IMI 116815) TaxID=1408163 RepID=A0A0F4YN79_RASE3|nr:Qde2-like protein [Rasamsonia emersonii CBS 393.64]KKA19108.1 Qde2-like protein [Rasamsonia emersonii CBS 393.64]